MSASSQLPVVTPTATVNLYTKAEAAVILKVKPGDIARLYRSGQLKAIRLAGTPQNPRGLRFTLAALQACADSFAEYDPVAATRAAA